VTGVQTCALPILPGRQRLEGGGEGLEVFAVVVGVLSAAEDGIELLQQLVVGEDLRVGGGQQRDQAALVPLVVEQHLLLGVAGPRELAALVAIGDGDRQTDGGGDGRGAVQRDPPRSEERRVGQE